MAASSAESLEFEALCFALNLYECQMWLLLWCSAIKAKQSTFAGLCCLSSLCLQCMSDHSVKVPLSIRCCNLPRLSFSSLLFLPDLLFSPSSSSSCSSSSSSSFSSSFCPPFFFRLVTFLIFFLLSFFFFFILSRPPLHHVSNCCEECEWARQAGV